jgi:tetratricopeptide (TPR) repeat protein
VGSILKGLGLTIWSLIAFGLLAIFIFVGYEAALKYRTSNGSVADESTKSDQSKHGPLDLAGGVGSPGPTDRALGALDRPALPHTPDATRKLLLSAAQNHQHDAVVEYGQQLVDGKSAGPVDLSIVAQSYLSVSDCANAQVWAQKAIDAFHASGIEPDDALRGVIACCPRPVFDSAEEARLAQFLSKTAAGKSDSGGPLVRLGELYYGFGQYERAIAAIQLGLQKGRIAHLDDAYVYLGLSEKAVGNFDEARNAFNQLKNVPGISPRILRLWMLYAETQLTATQINGCAKSGAG